MASIHLVLGQLVTPSVTRIYYYDDLAGVMVRGFRVKFWRVFLCVSWKAQ